MVVHSLRGLGKGMGHLAASRLGRGGDIGFDKVMGQNKGKAKLFKFLMWVDCHL